jgi:hypothetical protein
MTLALLHDVARIETARFDPEAAERRAARPAEPNPGA